MSGGVLPLLPVYSQLPRVANHHGAPRPPHRISDIVLGGSSFLAQCPSGTAPSLRRHSAVRCQASGGRSDDDQSNEPEGLLARPVRPGGGFGESPASTSQESATLGDWRNFRAALVAREAGRRPAGRAVGGERWAHLLSAPERGCLLLARRLDVGSLFMHSVIFLVGHGEEDLGVAGGSVGFIVNLPSPGILLSECGFRDDLAEPLQNALLYKGGPVCEGNLYVLHACRNVDGSYPVLDGVYTGGLASASEMVQAGLADPREFKMLSGYAGWGPGQLEAEVADGSWWVVAASVPVIQSAIQRCRESGSSLHEKKSVWQAILRMAGVDPTIYPPNHLCQ